MANSQLHGTTVYQLEPARYVAAGDSNDVVTEAALGCVSTPLTSSEFITTTTTITITTTTKNEPEVDRFPQRQPIPATARSGRKRDTPNVQVFTLKRNAERTRQKLIDNAKQMQLILEPCLRWLHQNRRERKEIGIAERYAAVEWLKDDLVGRLSRAGHFSGALQTWFGHSAMRLVTWTDICVVQAKLSLLERQ
jgi:hypothetical protein